MGFGYGFVNENGFGLWTYSSLSQIFPLLMVTREAWRLKVRIIQLHLVCKQVVPYLEVLNWYTWCSSFFISILFHNFPDIVGLLTKVSPEREYDRDGKLIKLVVIELTD